MNIILKPLDPLLRSESKKVDDNFEVILCPKNTVIFSKFSDLAIQ